MALDQKLKSQLKEARENICAQLEQLERGADNPYMEPNNRTVYAGLQRDLREIDALLEANGDTGVEASSAYQPMVSWYADQTVGNPVRTSYAGRVIGVITACFLILSLTIALLRAWSE